MRSNPSVSPVVFLKHVQCLVWLRKAPPVSAFQGISSNSAYLLQVIGGAISLFMSPRVSSQAPQHFRSTETRTTCDGYFSRQSVCSVISLDSSMSRTLNPHDCVNTHFMISYSSMFQTASVLVYITVVMVFNVNLIELILSCVWIKHQILMCLKI